MKIFKNSLSSLTLNAQNIKGSQLVTHDGIFHADEIVATAILKLLGGFGPERTRKIEKNDESLLLFDVGCEYNPEKHKFDHHQKDFDLWWFDEEDRKLCKMATAGIIWEHFGRAYVERVLTSSKYVQGEKFTECIHNILRRFIFFVDAIDVGRSDLVIPEGDFQDTFSMVISSLNTLDAYDVEGDQRKNFQMAVTITNAFLSQKIINEWNKKNFAALMKQAVSACYGKPILILEKAGAWIEYVLNHWGETEYFKLAIYPSGETYRVQSFPKFPEARQSIRCPAPEGWRGMRDEGLQKLTEIPEALFVHDTGFIGGTKTKDAAIRMAEKWIAAQ